VNGDKEVATKLLQHPFAHILFTGNGTAGKIVMKAAAEHLTPVTLELGGRNIAIVTEKANIELAATRTAWAKFAIAGQTCFAPNHVIVHTKVYDAFIEALKRVSLLFYCLRIFSHAIT
jgi:acyl-CoA reductase-like NAD-dependent aldehyde dehydrogenase